MACASASSSAPARNRWHTACRCWTSSALSTPWRRPSPRSPCVRTTQCINAPRRKITSPLRVPQKGRPRATANGHGAKPEVDAMTDMPQRGTGRNKNFSPADEELLALHPWVREAIHQDNRDRPLTMNWMPLDPDAYAQLGLPQLTRNATKARDQIITEALVAGPNRYISYSRRKEFYVQRQRYYRVTYSYRSIIPAVDQLAAAGLLDHERRPPGSRGYQSR